MNKHSQFSTKLILLFQLIITQLARIDGMAIWVVVHQACIVEAGQMVVVKPDCYAVYDVLIGGVNPVFSLHNFHD